jgi:type I restriction enzyme S subunit
MESKWDKAPLGDVAEIIDSRHKTPQYSENGLPMVRVVDVKGGRLSLANTKKISPSDYDDYSKGRDPQIGDLLISRVGSYGNIAYVDSLTKFCLGQNTALIIPKIHWRYLYYQLISPYTKGQIEENVVGAVQQTISLKSIRALEIPLPPLPEQKAIAHILGSLDDKIELNRKMNATLEAMAQALFKSWFVDFDPVVDNALRAGNSIPDELANRAGTRRQAIANGTANEAAAERFPGTFIDSDFGIIPNDYEIQTIEQCCTFVSRGVTPKYELGSGRFIINQKVNRGEELNLSHLKELTNSLNVSSEKHAQSYDVLVNCLGEGTLGRVHFYNGESGIYAVDQHMTICRPESPEFGLYLYQYLASPEGQDRIESAKTGSTGMTMFNIKKVRSFQIRLPSKQSLEAYGDKALDLYKNIQANRNQNLTLTKLRDTLLPKLISGELRVFEAEHLSKEALT